jgi:hypothetical protein
VNFFLPRRTSKFPNISKSPFKFPALCRLHLPDYSRILLMTSLATSHSLTKFHQIPAKASVSHRSLSDTSSIDAPDRFSEGISDLLASFCYLPQFIEVSPSPWGTRKPAGTPHQILHLVAKPGLPHSSEAQGLITITCPPDLRRILPPYNECLFIHVVQRKVESTVFIRRSGIATP